jgi:hypothetical protein
VRIIIELGSTSPLAEREKTDEDIDQEYEYEITTYGVYLDSLCRWTGKTGRTISRWLLWGQRILDSHVRL